MGNISAVRALRLNLPHPRPWESCLSFDYE